MRRNYNSQAETQNPDAPGPEVPRITNKHLLKPDKEVEEPSDNPQATFAETAVKLVEAKAQPSSIQGKTSPKETPLPETPKNDAEVASLKGVGKATESAGQRGSMRASKASVEEKEEKKLSKLQEAEAAERVGKEEWFKKSRNAKEESEVS
jgi:hypothetical protein